MKRLSLISLAAVLLFSACLPKKPEISLPEVLAEGLAPEFVQGACTADNLAGAVAAFLDAMYDTEKASYANKFPMEWDASSGVWSVTGDETWKGKFYLYEVKVFASSTGKIETNLVTDPYSISLSMNSKRSQIVDLNYSELKPQGWDTVQKPALAATEDIVLYELHIRDFSISDETVPEELRGTYKPSPSKIQMG